MKTYKIDPLGKNRPLMLVRGTRLPESFPDSVAEHMAKSLKANCRGVFATINGEISSSTVSPGVILSKEANEDNNTLVVMTEGMQNESVEWEDNTGKQFRLEHAGRFDGSQYGGNDPYYTGAHKDLRTFVTGAVPYTGQPLVAANAKQWYSYTTPEGVTLTFRGCIQAPEKGGTDFVGLKLDSIHFNGLDTYRNFDITLDCDSAVSLGLRNGMNDDSKPFNMRTGIGWLQIVATDDFKSHIKGFSESTGDGNAKIDPYGAYDGFTYNVRLAAISTQQGSWVHAGNAASFGIKVKSGSSLENSIIANVSGFACEDLGVDMSGSDNTFPMAEEVTAQLSAEPTVVNLTTDNRKQIVVIRFSSVQDGEKLHLDLSDTVTTPRVIYFRSMNSAILGAQSLGAGEKSFVIDIPRGDDVFAYFSVNYNAAGTLTLSRTKEQSEPVRTPGFYSADGQLIKEMTKEEVETDYQYGNYPATTPAVKNATSFVWPEGVTKVGNYAFGGCSGLTSVTIPEGVTKVGAGAFSGCSNLTSVTIPSTVTSIVDEAFNLCSSLTSVEIPEGVTSIGGGTFKGCTGLTSVTIPSTVTSIGNYVFKDCAGLTSVTIPSTVTSIGANAFQNCSGLTSVTIPEGVTTIGGYTFSNCSGLTSVTIPEGVTFIGPNAFKDCTSLNPLTVPNTVTTIDTDAFKGVPKVIYGGTATGTPWGALEVVAPPPTPGFYSADNQLIKAMTKEEVEQNYEDNNYPAIVTQEVKYATKFVWPDGVTIIGYRLFNGCTGLTSVTIPEGVTKVGAGAFQSCAGLISVTIPEGVTSIGNNAFNGCIGLTSVTIPEGVTTIGGFAFSDCAGLTSVTIPSTVTSIDMYVFDGCTGLTSVEIPEGVTSIGPSAFEGCTGLTSVTIPSTVTSIGSGAFQKCSSLTSVTIPEGVTSIGANAFQRCSNLTSVTIPSTVTSIEGHVFGDCSRLTSVTIPSTVTSIGNFAFSFCTSLNPLTVPNTVTTIGSGAFNDVPKVIYNGTATGSPWGATEVSTGGSTPDPGPNPGPNPDPEPTRDPGFYSADGQLIKAMTKEEVEQNYSYDNYPAMVNEALKTATEFVWPEGVTSIGNNAFYECTGLTSVTIPSTITTIGNKAFFGCTGLTSVTIPSTVTEIRDSAFNLCSSLTSVTIPSTVTTIGMYAFCGCTGLNPLTVPNTVTTIGENAFLSVPKVIYNGAATGSPWGANKVAAS